MGQLEYKFLRNYLSHYHSCTAVTILLDRSYFCPLWLYFVPEALAQKRARCNRSQTENERERSLFYC